MLAVHEVDVISGSDYLAVEKKNMTKMETKWRVISRIYTGYISGFTTISIYSIAFRITILYTLVDGYIHFGGTNCLYLHSATSPLHGIITQ